MFSSFLQSIKALFTRNETGKSKASDIIVSRQLDAELASTVEIAEDMTVTTRMQGKVSVGTQKQLNSDRSNASKRSSSRGVENTQEQPSAKRLRQNIDRTSLLPGALLLATKSSATKPTSTPPSRIPNHLQHGKSAEGRNVKVDTANSIPTGDLALQIPNSAESKQSGMNFTKGRSSNTIETEEINRTVPPTDIVDALQQRGKSLHIENDTQSGTSKRKRISKNFLKEPNAVVDPLRCSASPQPLDKPAVAVHKRFNSEESEPSEILQLSHNAESDEKSHCSFDGDSENDSPETLRASAGLDQARKKALGATKAASRQEEIQKRKRQERDKRLQTQAKVAKKLRVASRLPPLEEDPRSEGSEHSMSDKKGASPRGDNLKWNRSGRESLPLLLPDEILAADPVTRLPTPPLEHRRMMSVLSKKRKFLEADTKPPADIDRGPIRVRVLEVDRGTLTPKASKPSKIIRESWLAGRNASMQRRKIGYGFIRK